MDEPVASFLSDSCAHKHIKDIAYVYIYIENWHILLAFNKFRDAKWNSQQSQATKKTRPHTEKITVNWVSVNPL